MLLSCTWLSELLGRPIAVSAPFDANDPFSAPAIAATLTNLGLEVDGIEYCDLPGGIVGRPASHRVIRDGLQHQARRGHRQRVRS